MGFDLSTLETPHPGFIPAHMPEHFRSNPGYFRGLPLDLVQKLDLIDSNTSRPPEPDWPPAGLDGNRASELMDRWFTAMWSDEYPDDRENGRPLRASDFPTQKELRAFQTYFEKQRRFRSMGSKLKGKIPWYKFASNDSWIVTPEECLVIAAAIHEQLYEESAIDDPNRAWRVPKELFEAKGVDRLFSMSLPDSDQAILSPNVEEVYKVIVGLPYPVKDGKSLLFIHALHKLNARLVIGRTSALKYIINFCEGAPRQIFQNRKVSLKHTKKIIDIYMNNDESFKDVVPFSDVTEETMAKLNKDQVLHYEFACFCELAAKYKGFYVQ